MKRHTAALAIYALGFGTFAQIPNHHWTHSADGGPLAQGLCITTDNFGNVYTAGVFGTTSDFDPSAATSNLTSHGLDDIFIVKSSPQGDFIWAKNIGGSQSDIPNDITADVSGNVYLTGSFKGTADFDTESGVTNLVSNGGTDAFVVKLNSSGQLVWAKSVGGASDDLGQAIDIDDFNGNVYVIGTYFGTVDFNTGVGTMNVTSNGSSDIFMLRFSSNGDYLISKTFGSISADKAGDIFVDAGTGNQFLTGSFGGTTDFDPGAGVVNLMGSNDVFVLNLDSANNFVFVKKMGGIGVDEGRSIAVDVYGLIYVHGSFISTCNFNTSGGTTNVTSNGSDDVFVAQLSVSGNLNWVKTFGSIGTEDYMDMSVNRFGDIYLTGEMAGDMDANPDAVLVNTLTKRGAEDAYIIALGSDGGLNWATSYGNANPANYTRGFGIHVDEFDNVYAIGSFYSTVDFDPSAGVANSIAIDGSDVWYQKLGPGTNGIEEINPLSKLAVHPNPSNGLYTLNSEKILSNAEITITNLNGKIIQNFKLEVFNEFIINIENNTSGIYFLQVKSEGFNEVVKIVKQ